MPSFEGVVLSTWGRSLVEARNLVSFPPEKVAGHYKLIDSQGKIGLRWIDYIRAK